MSKVLNKKQVWARVENIIKDFELSPEVSAALSALLAPKKGGGTKVAPFNIDGTLHYYCRFTGKFHKSENMIYQNAEKRAALEDKGYSKIGISLWNKGQAHLKALKMKSVDIAYGADQSDEARAEGLKLHQEAMKLEADNSTNNYEWLVKEMATDEQKQILNTLYAPAEV